MTSDIRRRTEMVAEIRARAEKATAGLADLNPTIGPINHDEALELAVYKRHNSNMARSYLTLCDELDRFSADLALAKARWSEENAIVDRISVENKAITDKYTGLLRTVQARETLAGALGMNMDETVVEACRRTAEAAFKERDQARAENKAMRDATIEECAKVADRVAKDFEAFGSPSYIDAWRQACDDTAAAIRSLSTTHDGTRDTENGDSKCPG